MPIVSLNLDSVIPSGAPEDGGTLLHIVGDFSDYLGQEFEVHIGPNGDATDPKCLSGVPGQPNIVAPLNNEQLQIYTPLLARGAQIIYVEKVGASVSGQLSLSDFKVYAKDFKTSIYDHRKAWAPNMATGPRSIREEEPI